MTSPRTTRPIALSALALSVALLSGCVSAPGPTPSPTAAFASEEEAFAAAEETYRAYTEALNKVDTTDPDTFEALYDFSRGDFEASDRETFSMMHAEGYRIAGTTKVLHFAGVEASHDFETATARVCLDVSDVTVTDSTGESVVNPNRPNIYALEVTFVSQPPRMLIDSATTQEDEACGSA